VNAAEAVGDALDKFCDVGSWRPAEQDALHDALVDALTPYVLPHEPTETALRPEASGCQHCEPGQHAEFGSRAWSAFVSAYRDGDGQPTHLIVARADGGHVAESDAEAVRVLLREAYLQ